MWLACGNYMRWLAGGRERCELITIDIVQISWCFSERLHGDGERGGGGSRNTRTHLCEDLPRSRSATAADGNTASLEVKLLGALNQTGSGPSWTELAEIEFSATTDRLHRLHRAKLPTSLAK